MQDRPIEPNANTTSQATKRSPYTAFRSLDTLLTRGEVALKMVRDFSKCGVRDLANRTLQGLANQNSIAVMDLYGRSAQDAQQILRQQFGDEIAIRENRIPEEDACLKSLRQTDWIIERGQPIELLVNQSNGTVVGVRTSQSQQETDLSGLQRLITEFQIELTTLGDRTRNLENRVDRLDRPR
jgi:hypothetical protein